MTIRNAAGIVVGALLSSTSLAGFSSISDVELAATTGGENVLVVTSVDTRIDRFIYTDRDGGRFGQLIVEGLTAKGIIALQIGDISRDAFIGKIENLGVDIRPLLGSATDIVEISVPARILVPAPPTPIESLDVIARGGQVELFIRPDDLIDISIDAIKLGGSDVSLGSVKIINLDLRGTSIWIWAH